MSLKNNSSMNNNEIESKIFRPKYYHIKEGDFGIVWKNVIFFAVAHLLYIYACFVALCYFNWKMQIWNAIMSAYVAYGVTGGAHRLWAHKSFKAKLPLQIFLAIGQSLTGQNCIYIWARDHRIHHKYSDTDGDPHNTKRGFFFAHVGWLLKKKHPEVKLRGARQDLSDLQNDPLVMFQAKYYYPIFFVFALFIPVYVPYAYLGASLWHSFLVCFVHRMAFTLHISWSVNSAAHMFGDRPYDSNSMPAENSWVSFAGFGEGYHNYHHKFPFDYAAAEFGIFNLTRQLIEFMQSIGQAYDLKRASSETVMAVKQKQIAKSLH